jgi:L-malate glycosyltransferase
MRNDNSTLGYPHSVPQCCHSTAARLLTCTENSVRNLSASNKIKVLKFLTHFGVGGTERQFVYTTSGLDRSRFDVRVACLAKIGPFMKDVEALQVPISVYPTHSLYSYQTLRRQVQFAREIRREGIQVVHAYGFYPNLFAILPARLGTRSVTIASVRDMGVFTDRHKIKGMSQAFACRFADCIIANSNAVRGWLMRQGLGGQDIRVVPNGIPIPPTRSQAESSPVRKEFNLDPECPLIAVVGRLVRTKGLEFFLEAAVSIATRFPSVRFLIVGDSCAEPAYRVELENRAKELNLSGKMIFTGQRSDVPQIMREIDISVLPSLSESFSNTLLESMANGLPVIATNVGGNPELVSDGIDGILIPPKDPAALTRAAVQLLESSALAHRLGKAAREKVVREYSLESLLRRTEDLYISLLERRGLYLQHSPITNPAQQKPA